MLEQMTVAQIVGIGQEADANRDRHSKSGRLLKQLSWWVLLLICVVFGAYGLYMGGLEILARLGVPTNAPHRAVSLVFILHALAGGIALPIGPLQFNRALRVNKRNLHRILGRIYVGTILMVSVTGLWSAIFFDRVIAARIVFGVAAILLFSTTTIAFLRARRRNFKEHREWMIRSFALTLFNVTFTFWVDGLASTSLPEAVSYPLGVFLGWSLNLAVAELWIRLSRSRVRSLIHELTEAS